MAQFDIANFNRFILNTEDDANSPINEEYIQQLREILVGLILLMVDTGVSGSATDDPPDDATGQFEDTALGIADDEYNQMTLLITSGTAKGMFYTIDDCVQASDSFFCTGDNLYAAGVRSGDTYKVLYDIIANLDGHDHDGYNSKGGTVADSAISQAKLKTTSGEVGGAAQNYTLPGGEYGFYPQIKDAGITSPEWQIGVGFGGAAYVTNIYHAHADCRSQQRYVQASGEVFWIFISRDKLTKKICGIYEAPDHPCMGNGGKPQVVWHPFPDFNESTHEIVVINPSPAEVLAMRMATVIEDETKPDRDMISVILEDYEIDELTEADWPDKEVTVALPKDWEDAWASRRPVIPIKKKIPKPKGVLCRRLIKK